MSELTKEENKVSMEEVEKITFIYKQLDKGRRGILLAGSAMLLASQKEEKDEALEEGRNLMPV